jgi:hypothetical protein
MALFSNIEKGGTPEKIAENDYLMKCESGRFGFDSDLRHASLMNQVRCGRSSPRGRA